MIFLGMKSAAQRLTLASLALFTLNTFLCWPLLRIEYLDDFQSNEGVYITASKFLLDSWPHFTWFPWVNTGTPFENAYFPFLEFLTALVAWLTRWSPAHAFHVLAAVTYALGPVFLFLLMRKMSGRLDAAFGSALLWSLISPSSVIPALHRDMGSWWGPRRLRNLVYYGEAPHIAALTFTLLGLWLLLRFWEKPSPRRFALCGLAFGAAMLTNIFAVAIIAGSMAMLLAVLKGPRAKRLLQFTAISCTAYLLISRFLPPSLVWLIRTNAPLVDGDYRLTPRGALLGAVFFATLLFLWWITRRLGNPMFRLAILFAACFSAITVMGYLTTATFLIQPRRYMVEMDLGICLLLPFAFAYVAAGVPRRFAAVAGALALVALSAAILEDYRFSRGLIRPADLAQSPAYREARWIATNLPGQRVMIAGENEFWFNLFAGNPQLGAGHDGMEPNWVRRFAVYTIYTGENLGSQDGPISILWLKAFGCGAITVPGPDSRDYFHPFRKPRKFDGLLPLVWREGDDSIYQLPLGTSSLAHVIPTSVIVPRPPVHGGDVGPLRPYVAALEDPSSPPAKLSWHNPERGQITAHIGAGQAISLQISYDPGWRASIRGVRIPLHKDALGMMTIDPKCDGECTIDLEYTGGTERTACAVVGCSMGLVLVAMLVWPAKAKRAQSPREPAEILNRPLQG